MLSFLSQVFLILALIIGIVFFGAVHIWAWSLVLFLSFLALLCGGALAIRQGRPFPIPPLLLAILLIITALMGWSALDQRKIEVPPVSQKIQYYSPSQVSLSLTRPLSPFRARLAFYKWLLPLFAFLAVGYILSSPQVGKRLLFAIFLLAGLEGIYGIWEFLARGDPTFFSHVNQQGPVTGTFVNRNTFASFMAMGVSLGLGFIWQWSREGERGDSKKESPLFYYLYHHSKRYWMAGGLVLLLAMSISVFLSLSRAGVALILAVYLVFSLSVFYKKREGEKRLLQIAGAFAFFALLGGYLYLLGLEDLSGRFSQLESHATGRFELWMVTLDIIRDHWLWGVGGGSFPLALEIYRPPKMRGFFLYAHNDYLQFWAEYGIILTVGGGSFLAIYFWKVGKTFQNKNPKIPFPLRWGSLVAIGVILTHGLVDFSLHVPGLQLATALLFGVLLAEGEREYSKDEKI